MATKTDDITSPSLSDAEKLSKVVTLLGGFTGELFYAKTAEEARGIWLSYVGELRPYLPMNIEEHDHGVSC